MLAQIEPGFFVFGRNPKADYGVDDFQNDKGSDHHKHQRGKGQYHLNHELARVSKKQSLCSNRGKQPGCQDSGKSSHSVNGHHVKRVIVPKSNLQDNCGVTKDPGHESNQQG